MSQEDIFHCADHRHYLKSYLAAQKPGLGVRALARKAGFKSPGHLSLIVQGERRLTVRSAELLAKALALRGRRKALFLAFAALDSCRSEADREKLRAEILHLRTVREEFLLSEKEYSYLAVWYYPIIYGMIENNPRCSEPTYLAKNLGRGVTIAEVTTALNDMLAIGLLEKTDDGRYRALHASLTTPPEPRALAARKYHRNTNQLAQEALNLPLAEREFGGLTVAVPKKLLPQIKEKMRAFRAELNELISREIEPADIYQINLQLFPLTSQIERINHENKISL